MTDARLGPWGPNDTTGGPSAAPGSADPAPSIGPWEATRPVQADGAAASSATTGRPTSLTLGWAGTHGLAGLAVVNFLLKIMTLGLYGFWGKTEVRRRIWSAIRVEGEPFEYTGHGRELIVGFMVVFGVVMLPAIVLTALATLFGSAAVSGTVQAALYLLFALLYGIGAYRAQRYRLARTRWRGIRMRLAGSSWTYGWTYFWTLLLLPPTLGWIAPWRTTRLQRMMTRNTSLGDRPLRFTASSGALYARYAILWIGTALILLAVFAVIGAELTALTRKHGNLVHLPEAAQMRLGGVVAATAAVAYLLYGIVAAWYRARVINHFAANTHFENARFAGSASAGGLVWLAVTNTLMVVLTVGILGPVAQARQTRYLVEHLRIEGEVDLAAIGQAPDDGLTRGEGLAQAFDFDAF